MVCEQFPGHGKAQQLKVPAVHDFKRLGGIDDRKIAGSADLLMATLDRAG